MLKPRRAVVALAVAVLGTVTACSSSGPAGSPGSTTPRAVAAAFPITVQAGSGTVTIARKPTAIVSLSPTVTEMLFAIGAGSQVKAVDKNSDYPAAAPHTKLDAYQVNAEAIASYQPDLVVASGLTSAQSAQLRRLHIPVLDEPAATNLDQSYQEIAQLGRVTDHQDAAAAEVTRMKQQIAAIVSGTPKPAKGTTYYYELDQTYYSETSSTFIGQLLKMLGLSSIADAAKGAAASGGYPQLTAEYVLKSDPTYVFLADTRCCKQSTATVAKRPGWSTLAAVRDGRVVALDDDIASRWGPRTVDLLRTIAQAIKLHPAPAKP